MRRAALLVFTGVVTVAGVAAAAEPFRQLKGAEIKTRFSGMEFTDDVHWATVFAKNGSFASYEMGAVGKGRWTVVKDELCLTETGAAHRCYQIWASGKDVQLRREGMLPENGVLQKPVKREAR